MEKTNLFEFQWVDQYDHLAKSDVFYCLGYTHNAIAYIRYNNRIILISCDGEMDFWYNDVRIRSCNDLVEAGITTDTEWLKAREEIHDGSFPWFDAYIEDPETYELEHLDMVHGDLDDIILNAQQYLMEITK
jgi:hypothetical protein